jgi:hypothetical protein
MAVNPLKNTGNRANEIKREEVFTKRSITLYDVDFAISQYMQDVVIPQLEESGQKLNVPLIYGNAERWKGAQIDGVFRDSRGKIQIPMIMFKRNTVARNESMQMLNRHLSYTSQAIWSKKNAYDKFSILNNFRPKKEVYNITMPDYVDVTYQVMVWTNYTEHMNTIVEAFQYASDEYWGDKAKFKFNTKIDNFETSQDMVDGGERIIRTTFTMVVKAYLLPEKFDGDSTIKKSISPKAIQVDTNIIGEEKKVKTDDYTGNKLIYDYITLNGTVIGTYTLDNQIIFENIKYITPPSGLDSLSEADTIKIYINGQYQSPTSYELAINDTSITATFNTSIIGFNVDAQDEVTLNGKIKLLQQNTTYKPLTFGELVNSIETTKITLSFLSENSKFFIFENTNYRIADNVQGIPKFEIDVNSQTISNKDYVVSDIDNHIKVAFRKNNFAYTLGSDDVITIDGPLDSI